MKLSFELLAGELKVRQLKKVFTGPSRPYEIDLLEEDTHLTLVQNLDFRLSLGHFHSDSAFVYQNADFFELHYIVEGAGQFHTSSGSFSFKSGDFWALPQSLRYQVKIESSLKTFRVETREALNFPGECENIGKKAPTTFSYSNELKIKRLGEISTLRFPTPFLPDDFDEDFPKKVIEEGANDSLKIYPNGRNRMRNKISRGDLILIDNHSLILVPGALPYFPDQRKAFILKSSSPVFLAPHFRHLEGLALNND